MEHETKGVLRSQFLWICSIGGSLIIISTLYMVNVSVGIENFSNTISLPAYTIIPGTLVILSIWAVTKSETIKELPRKALIFLMLSFLCWFLAEQTWNLYEHVIEIDPYPSIADFFYLAAPLFMFISLTIFLKSTEKKISKIQIFFSSVIALIVLIPSLVFTVDFETETHLLEIIVGAAYPIADSILLVPAVITILFLIGNKRSFFWFMILSGIITMLAADTIFLFLVVNDGYVDGHPVDILWVSSYTIWMFMMFFIITESNAKNSKYKHIEIYKRESSKKIEKFGVIIALGLINFTVGLLLIGINYFFNPKPDNTILEFFSWVLVIVVIIFSSIIIILNSKLNKTLHSRTLQLEKTTSELIKSERFSAIGELASRISHDIRNPLSNIQMSIELMKNSPPQTKLTDDMINDKLELVSKNVQRISHQINDVLGFVQDRNLKEEEFQLEECLRETIETIFCPKNILIEIPKSTTKILADFFQLQIVFNNLLVNAIQAIGKEEGKILCKINEKDNKIIIKIENSGPSIPENIMPHIFESLVTTKQVGTGLGLVSCKTIIENHKGTIEVKNNPTTFIIIIPNTRDHKEQP